MQVKVGSAFISCKLAQGDCGPGVSIVGEHNKASSAHVNLHGT